MKTVIVLSIILLTFLNKCATDGDVVVQGGTAALAGAALSGMAIGAILCGLHVAQAK